LDACYAQNASLYAADVDAQIWQELLPKTKLKANYRHVFEVLRHSDAVTHVRLQIYPDGGVSRLRVLGRAELAEASGQGIAGFNRLARRKVIESLLDCCGSRKWAEQLAKERPFKSREELFAASDKIWSALSHHDWLEAFDHHPPIGGKRAKAKSSAKASRWSASEQSAAQTTAPDLLVALGEANLVYAEKFGYVFLICAAEKTSQQILQAMRQRMSNSSETEMRVAAEEQRKITRLRMEKLLNS
jgi:allantoicase